MLDKPPDCTADGLLSQRMSEGCRTAVDCIAPEVGGIVRGCMWADWQMQRLVGSGADNQ